MKNLVFVGKTFILVVLYAAIFAISLACLVSWPLEFFREAGTIPCIVASIITAFIFLLILVKIHMADFFIGAFISALCTFIIGGILSIFYLPMLCTEDGLWYAAFGTVFIVTVLILLLRKKGIGEVLTNFFDFNFYYIGHLFKNMYISTAITEYLTKS